MIRLDKKPEDFVKELIPVFTKGQILEAKRFSDYKDALSVVLQNCKNYTMDNVEKELEKFMKGKVK